MIEELGIMKEVTTSIEGMHRDKEAADRRARFSHVDEDGNAIMMARNVNRGFGASSRDPNFKENVRRLVSGGREKGYCAVAKCDHPEMELLHKCHTCKRYVHVICLMTNNLLISEEGGDDYHYCSRLCVK